MFICIEISNFVFFNFLDLNKFLIVLSTLPQVISLTILLLLALNAFRTNILKDLIVFNIKVNIVTILLKP